MDIAEFQRRRRELMQMMGDDAIAILPAAPEQRRNRDVFHPYRQDSDFWYLTGFGEPDAVAVLAPGRGHGEYLLFCRERDPAREIWDGPIVGPENAVSEHGADDAFPIDDIDEILPGLIEGRSKVYCTMGADPDFDHRLIGWVNQVRARGRSGARVPAEYVALEHPLHELRLIKSRAELEVMRRAAAVSADAHRQAMATCRPGLREYEIEAIFHGAARRHDGWQAYPPIVGGGSNACVLHYIRNGDVLRDGDLLLIDAGVELENYASDITRTFPVNGRFSPAQRDVYEIVLAAQHAAIDAVGPDHHWNAPHEAATRVLVQGMVDLGLLRGDVDGLIESGEYRRFFMHRTGHWLGMDVHDVGDYRVDGHWRQLEPGMVLTVEPGLYIAAGGEGVPPHLADIGIRIEDDVVVTRDGCEIITGGAPKTVDEIEQVMAG
jgi:Xaa-Pro aminopeptidase